MAMPMVVTMMAGMSMITMPVVAASAAVVGECGWNRPKKPSRQERDDTVFHLADSNLRQSSLFLFPQRLARASLSSRVAGGCSESTSSQGTTSESETADAVVGKRNLDQPVEASASRVLNSSTVLASPSRSGIFGSQRKFFCDFVMSGRRCLGSSFGNGS